MKIESLLFPGSTERQNEDHIYVGTDTFAVFDGASSLVPFRDTEGNTGGFLASKIAYDVFQEYENRGYSLAELFERINVRLSGAMEKEGIDGTQKEALWCTTAAAVRIQKTQIEFAQITDAIILAIYENGTYKELGKHSDHDKDTLIEWKSLGNVSQKEKRVLVDKTIIRKRQEQNISYGALSGEPEYRDFLQIGNITKEGIAHILLFTDGLIPYKENPEDADDYSELVQVFLKSGIKGVNAWIKKGELSDPECTRYARFKMHDDVGAISISL